MITAHVESFIACLPELRPLFVPHYRELALDQDKVPLDPEYSIYFAREAAGELLLVTLRDKGAIVAYFIGFVAPGLHYRTCLTLTEDIFWLHPDYRGEDSLDRVEANVMVEQLFGAVKAEALKRKVQRVFLGTKVHQDAGKLFEAMGLREVDRYYSAWWGE